MFPWGSLLGWTTGKGDTEKSKMRLGRGLEYHRVETVGKAENDALKKTASPGPGFLQICKNLSTWDGA